METMVEVELGKITPGKNSRQTFDKDALAELAASIKEKGVIEPIIIRPKKDGFEVVAGERRFRAAKDAGLKTIPSIVKELTDEEAYQISLIENLQRKDLTELEEARSFQKWMGKGKAAEAKVKELASRTGIDPRYIRRRVRVLNLPQEILKAWEGGKLTFSHLEQLRRIEGDKEIMNLYRNYGRRESARELKDTIDRMALPLDKAPFKIKEAGCPACMNNSACQQDLFGIEDNGTKCLKPDCYREKAIAYMTEHWAETPMAKKFKTLGFRLVDLYDSARIKYENLWKLGKDCAKCENFVTIIRKDDPGTAYCDKACIDPACYRKTFKIGGTGGTGGGRTETRKADHGLMFRESFLQQALPGAVSPVPESDEKIHRLTLAAMIHSNGSLKDQLVTGESWDYQDEKIWAKIIKMKPEEVREAIKQAALKTALEDGYSGYSPKARLAVGTYFGLDLQRDWRLSKEYLSKKTKAEIIKTGTELFIIPDKLAQKYLYENLGKKRGKIDTCSKKELIQLIMECGVDLAGKVPKEILEAK